MDNFTIASDITWLNFQFTLSEKLLVRPTDLNLAYRFSSDPRNQPPNRLSDAVSFIEMIAAAQDGLAGYAAARAKAKKGTTKPAKPFKVEIVNLDTGNAKATSRGGTKKGATGNRAKQRKVSLRRSNKFTILILWNVVCYLLGQRQLRWQWNGWK